MSVPCVVSAKDGPCEGDVTLNEFYFYGLRVIVPLCMIHLRWIEKFYREDRAAAQRDK